MLGSVSCGAASPAISSTDRLPFLETRPFDGRPRLTKRVIRLEITILIDNRNAYGYPSAVRLVLSAAMMAAWVSPGTRILSK